MGMSKFFSANSQMNKPLAANISTNPLRRVSSALINRNNVASTVEHQFKRMSEAHDRIRTQLLSQTQNPR